MGGQYWGRMVLSGLGFDVEMEAFWEGFHLLIFPEVSSSLVSQSLHLGLTTQASDPYYRSKTSQASHTAQKTSPQDFGEGNT